MSIVIDPQIERDLIVLAEKRNLSVNGLLRVLTAQEKRYWQERVEDEAQLEAMRNGDYISGHKMMEKFDQLAERARKRAQEAS